MRLALDRGDAADRLCERHRCVRRPDPTERLLAVNALPDEHESCPALLAAADDPSPDVAAAALARLGRLGTAAEAAALRARLLSYDLAVVPACARALRALGDPNARPSAEAALHAASRDHRVHAALALQVLAESSSASALRRALTDELPVVRRVALVTLARVLRSQGDVAAFVRCLRDPSAGVRAAAVRALAATVQDPAPLLAPAVTDPDPRVRRAVARLGGRVAHARVLLTDPDVQVRRAAARAGRDLERLASVARDDPTPAVRQAATRALGDHPSPDALHSLLASLGDEHASVRVAALEALEGRLGRREAAGCVAGLLRSTSSRQRAAGLRALARMHATAPADALGELCDDPEVDVRLALAQCAVVIAEAPSAVLARLAHDADPDVRHGATIRLQDLHRRAERGPARPPR